MGYWLWQGANGPLWEGIFGLVSAIFVGAFVVHMWRTVPYFKQEMEGKLQTATQHKAGFAAAAGVFLFTLFMITREGMETALLLLQIHEPRIVVGVTGGIIAAASMCFLWARFGHLINLKRFFQVTAIFLMLFVVQILIYSFHEFTEAGLFPNSEFLHIATEPYGPDGLYGKWFSVIMIGLCALWLLFAWLQDALSRKPSAKPAV
jgi:high-affinity iron transporter